LFPFDSFSKVIPKPFSHHSGTRGSPRPRWIPLVLSLPAFCSCGSPPPPLTSNLPPTCVPPSFRVARPYVPFSSFSFSFAGLNLSIARSGHALGAPAPRSGRSSPKPESGVGKRCSCRLLPIVSFLWFQRLLEKPHGHRFRNLPLTLCPGRQALLGRAGVHSPANCFRPSVRFLLSPPSPAPAPPRILACAVDVGRLFFVSLLPPR